MHDNLHEIWHNGPLPLDECHQQALVWFCVWTFWNEIIGTLICLSFVFATPAGKKYFILLLVFLITLWFFYQFMKTEEASHFSTQNLSFKPIHCHYIISTVNVDQRRCHLQFWAICFLYHVYILSVFCKDTYEDLRL